jgi:hypothetical protein
MRSFVFSFVAVLFLGACTLQSGNTKLARRGRESWNVDGRTCEVVETYYKWAGSSLRFVMVSKVAAAMLGRDEVKTHALPLIRYARDHRMPPPSSVSSVVKSGSGSGYGRRN